jgi:hypothetical protein
MLIQIQRYGTITLVVKKGKDSFRIECLKSSVVLRRVDW